jgi:ATP-dependent DNA ligase
MEIDIINVLNECASDNGRLFKIEVIEKNKDNELLKNVIIAALDPYTQYYIRQIPDYITVKYCDFKSLDWALNRLKELSSRSVTGTASVEHLRKTIRSVSPNDAEVVKRIIAKDLKCGVHKSTVNKVFGRGFIETYPCMLASSMNEKNFKNIKFPAIVQTKMDGMRANIILDDKGKVEIRSRNGKQIDLHGLFDETFNIVNAVVDGELIVLDADGAILDRKTGNGILNKAVKGTISDEEASRVRMTAWDLIPLEDFKAGKCDIPYDERMRSLFDIDRDDKIDIVDDYVADDMDMVRMIFEESLADGQEGVIVKNTDSPWEDKRSKYQVKMKVELEADLLVTGWNFGSGKIAGLMGSVTCTTADGCVVVNVGSGFNDEDRKMLPEDIVGKIITVKYNEVIQDKNKKTKSLFLPIYVELRLDKDKPDII